MKTNSELSGLSLSFSVVMGVVLILLLVCTSESNGQTNTFPSTGSAGVGTTSPGQKLEVYTTTSSDGIKLNDGSVNSRWLVDPGSVAHGIGTVSPHPFYLFTNGSARVWIDSSGNVGIGPTSPGNLLHVSKSLDADTDLLKLEDTNLNTNRVGLAFKSASGLTAAVRAKYTNPASTTATELQFFTNPTGGNNNLTQRMVIDGSGNVGIGTTNPGSKLEVSGKSRFDSTGSFSGIDQGWSTSIGWSTGNYGVRIGATGGQGVIQVAQNTTAYDLALQPYGGNVGIGTATPNTKLEVNGTITATNVIAKFQDVAEWVPSSEPVSAGTVVVLDSTKSNHVISSTVSYDMRVAGVVSAEPGIALGEKSEGKVLVATTGRVRVKVDATKSPIHVGDLLVTSDVSGVAMKSEPINVGGVQIHRPGTLIGKALEPLEKGKGEILVLLSLQ